MKKSNYLISGVAFYCLMSLFLSSCEKGDLSNETTDRTAPTTNSTNLVTSGDCNSDCIIPDGPYFVTSDSQLVQWGGQSGTANSKTVDIEYYNTETDFVIKIKSTNGWSDLTFSNLTSVADLQIPSLGLDWTGGNTAANTWGVFTIPLNSDWQACNTVSFTMGVAGNGPPASFNINYNLIGICETGCETMFTGEALSCDQTREAKYTFVSSETLEYIKIQGGLTNFTGEDAVVTVEGGNLEATQWTPGGSSNRIIKVEGSVSECTPVTITITWNSTNSGSVITGDWSIKDGNGNEIAPSISGLECP